MANLVDPWRGNNNNIPVIEFFVSVDEAAEMSRLSTKDKVRIARLKLGGAAGLFYSAQPLLKADDVTYGEFRRTFVDRFKDKHTDQFNYSRLQTAVQEKSESHEVFLDRLRKLCQRTIHSGNITLERMSSIRRTKKLVSEM